MLFSGGWNRLSDWFFSRYDGRQILGGGVRVINHPINQAANLISAVF